MGDELLKSGWHYEVTNMKKSEKLHHALDKTRINVYNKYKVFSPVRRSSGNEHG